MINKKAIIAFSGKVGSGKTTISTEIAHILGWEWVSFGNYIRNWAKENNLSDDRKTLQDLGEFMLNQNIDKFCLSVLDQVKWRETSFVVDGVRHKEVLTLLKKVVLPIPLYHIHVTINKMIQKERVLSRGSEIDITLIESHSTEAQTSQILAKSADLILDSSLPVERLIDDIKSFLRIKGVLIIE